MRHSPWPRPSKYAFANSLQSALKLDERGLLHSYLTWRKIRQMDHFLPLILGGSGCKSAVAGLFEIWRRHDCQAVTPETWADLISLIEGSEFAVKRCVYLRCIQCHIKMMTLDAPKMKATFEGICGTLNQRTRSESGFTDNFGGKSEQIPRLVVFLGFGGHFWASRRTIPHWN